MAFPDGWSHQWAIPINADSVITSAVTDWPCLVTDAYFPAGAWALVQYLMIGGLWQGASGEVSLFFGEHQSGDLHLLTSADRGTTWH